MNRISAKLRSRGDLELAMTPMIDVVFLLLIFFLVTASFQRSEQSLPTGISETPKSVTTTATGIEDWTKELSESGDEIVIKLSLNDGVVAYRLNDKPVAGPVEIATRLQALVLVKADVPIIVDPSDQVPMGSAIEIYDVAKGVGAVEVFFATRL